MVFPSAEHSSKYESHKNTSLSSHVQKVGSLFNQTLPKERHDDCMMDWTCWSGAGEGVGLKRDPELGELRLGDISRPIFWLASVFSSYAYDGRGEWRSKLLLPYVLEPL
mmetsp:Transcript_13675/g.13219  ORF Transcript_13675/g.13219 Transcript_13675/m.13219 type:complete len:109 (-) Transcript_13675:357-683(-)